MLCPRMHLVMDVKILHIDYYFYSCFACNHMHILWAEKNNIKVSFKMLSRWVCGKVFTTICEIGILEDVPIL